MYIEPEYTQRETSENKLRVYVSGQIWGTSPNPWRRDEEKANIKNLPIGNVDNVPIISKFCSATEIAVVGNESKMPIPSYADDKWTSAKP